MQVGKLSKLAGQGVRVIAVGRSLRQEGSLEARREPVGPVNQCGGSAT